MSYRPKIKSADTGTVIDLPLDAETLQGLSTTLVLTPPGGTKPYILHTAVVKKINTDNSTSQAVNSSEKLHIIDDDQSTIINLHKISKTGDYNDLLNKPTISTDAPSKASTNDTVPTSKAVYDAIASATGAVEPINLCSNKWVYGSIDAFGKLVRPTDKSYVRSECAIPVKPNTKYTIKVYGVNLATIKASYYTEPNYNYPTGAIQAFISDSTASQGHSLEFTTASTCYRLMITISGLVGSTADLPINAINCMLIKGSESDLPNNYIEYKKNGVNISKDHYTLWKIDALGGIDSVGSFNESSSFKDINGSNPILAGLNTLIIKYCPNYDSSGYNEIKYKKFDLATMVNNIFTISNQMIPKFFLSESDTSNLTSNVWREFQIKIYPDFSIGLKFNKAWNTKTGTESENLFVPLEIYAIYEDD